MQTHIRGMQLHVIFHGYKRLYRFVLMFLYCFCPWPYTRNVLTCCRDGAAFFSNVAPVFRNLF